MQEIHKVWILFLIRIDKDSNPCTFDKCEVKNYY